ncbi:hypothetical protein QVD17_31065 [Tagetes erecta]|uniref:Uncharacterized protein n=1 Tax=Tagetes erecta TaxID=13708 RepID=A0AAD8K6T2_TARER|nr:hypothetical protein QVD17_31065 [Tagetes erecta]
MTQVISKLIHVPIVKVHTIWFDSDKWVVTSFFYQLLKQPHIPTSLSLHFQTQKKLYFLSLCIYQQTRTRFTLNNLLSLTTTNLPISSSLCTSLSSTKSVALSPISTATTQQHQRTAAVASFYQHSKGVKKWLLSHISGLVSHRSGLVSHLHEAVLSTLCRSKTVAWDDELSFSMWCSVAK